jgi:uncharacterized protein YneF (UPF0154 family)
MKIVIGAIIVFFGLDKILRKYGHIEIKQIWRTVMDKSWIFSKLAILWIEHIAMVFGGVVIGWWINKRMNKKDVMPERIITQAQVRAIVSESITPIIEEQIVEEDVIKKESICPEWGKEFVKAIGQVWLEKNFGKGTITGRTQSAL